MRDAHGRRMEAAQGDVVVLFGRALGRDWLGQRRSVEQPEIFRCERNKSLTLDLISDI